MQALYSRQGRQTFLVGEALARGTSDSGPENALTACLGSSQI